MEIKNLKDKISFLSLMSLFFLGLMLLPLRAEIKPFSKIYFDYHATSIQSHEDDKDSSSEKNGDVDQRLSQFEVERVYFGIKGDVDTDIGKISYNSTFDVQKGVDLKNTEKSAFWTSYLKIAYLKWNFFNITTDNLLSADVTFGLQSAQLFGFTESFWGYRHVAKVFTDHTGFYTAADAGINVAAKAFNDLLAVNVFHFNGDGYNKVQNTSTRNYGANVTLNLKEIFLPFYLYGAYHYNSHASSADKTTYVTALAYKNELFRAYVEYSQQNNYAYEDGDIARGLMLGGNYHLISYLDLFFRYDIDLSDQDKDNNRVVANADAQNIYLGVALTPIKSFQVVLTYHSLTYHDRLIEAYSSLFRENDDDDFLEHSILFDFQFTF